MQIYQTVPNEFARLLPPIKQALPDKSSTKQTPAVEFVSPIPLYLQLAGTHYERLIRVANDETRFWYMHEAASENWSYETSIPPSTIDITTERGVTVKIYRDNHCQLK